MNETYSRIEALCRSRGINITELCKRCSIPRASLTDFKMGRNKSLSAATLQKIAEYFSVSVEYLLSGEAPSSERINLKVAFFGGEEGVVGRQRGHNALRLQTGDIGAHLLLGVVHIEEQLQGADGAGDGFQVLLHVARVGKGEA